MNRARLRAVGAASLIVLAVCVPAEVRALTSAELTCLDSIGQGGARFAQRTHAALIACDDAIVVGGSCNTQQRDAVMTTTGRSGGVGGAERTWAPLSLRDSYSLRAAGRARPSVVSKRLFSTIERRVLSRSG